MLNTMSKRGFLDKYPNEILGVYFKSYFRGTYRIIMKYNADYFSELQGMIEKMKGNGIVLSSQLVKESLSPKERFEIFLLEIWHHVLNLSQHHTTTLLSDTEIEKQQVVPEKMCTTQLSQN